MAVTMYTFPRCGKPAGTLPTVAQADLIGTKARGISVDVGGVPYGVAFIVRDDLLSSPTQVRSVLASLVAAINADANALVPAA
jgi:hypothetical protein